MSSSSWWKAWGQDSRFCGARVERLCKTNTPTPTVQEKNNKTCGACRFWVGRCLKGKKNRIACDDASKCFEAKITDLSVTILNLPVYTG